MGWLVELFAGTGFAAATGLIGGAVNKLFDLKKARMDQAHEVEVRRLDIEESKLDREHELLMADKSMDVAELEGVIEIESKQVDAFVSSQKTAGRNKVLTYVRASITYLSLIGFCLVMVDVSARVGGLDSMPAGDLVALYIYMVKSVVFLGITCASWWFAAQGGNLKGMFSK